MTELGILYPRSVSGSSKFGEKNSLLQAVRKTKRSVYRGLPLVTNHFISDVADPKTFNTKGGACPQTAPAAEASQQSHDMLSVRIPHHCRAECLVHQCTAAPPKTAQTPEWAVFSGTQLCLAADAFASSCKFFQRTLLITLSSPILKEISAHKSRIKVFLGL